MKCLTIQNEEKKRWKMRKDEERWIPQNEEDGIFKMKKRDGDGIELPLFQVIDQTGRMAASSR